MNKEFEVTVKFKIIGDMHSRVTDEHIKRNLISELKEGNIREFEMWHEYYGDFDEISTMFLKNDVEVVRFEQVSQKKKVIKPKTKSVFLQGYLNNIEKAKNE